MSRVSIVMPAYESWETIAGSIDAIERQRYRDFELIVVDSSPSERTAALLEGRALRLLRPARRCLPHAARNLGVEIASGELLVFTDPDVYAAPEWLERLVAHADRGAPVVVGAVACFGDAWFDQGVHRLKYFDWLPGTAETANTQSANLLVRRATFEAFGGFPEGWTGDSELAWWLADHAVPVRFAADAIVEHHHLASPGDFVRERFARAVDFTRARARYRGWSPPHRLAQAALTASGLRFLRQLTRHAALADRRGDLGGFLRSAPVLAAGLEAWQLGELAGLLSASRRRR